MPEKTVLEGVREYGEGYPVELDEREGRQVIRAINQGGYDSTEIDLDDLIGALKKIGVAGV